MKLRLSHLLWPHISRIGRCLSVVLLGLTAAGFSLAQQPVDRQSLGSLTFVRQSFARNFYNTYKVMSALPMEAPRLLLPNSADVVLMDTTSAPTLAQRGRVLGVSGQSGAATAATLRVGAFHPYLCYEASFSGMFGGSRVDIDLLSNDEHSVVARTLYADGAVRSYGDVNGARALLAEREVGLHDSISDVAHGAPLKSLYTPCPHPPTTGEWGHGFLI